MPRHRGDDDDDAQEATFHLSRHYSLQLLVHNDRRFRMFLEHNFNHSNGNSKACTAFIIFTLKIVQGGEPLGTKSRDCKQLELLV